jgi:hypothetical protein
MVNPYNCNCCSRQWLTSSIDNATTSVSPTPAAPAAPAAPIVICDRFDGECDEREARRDAERRQHDREMLRLFMSAIPAQAPRAVLGSLPRQVIPPVVQQCVLPPLVIEISSDSDLGDKFDTLRDDRRSVKACKKHGKERLLCSKNAWHSPTFHAICRLVVWSWLRTSSPHLLPWEDLSSAADHTRPPGPQLTNDVCPDGSLTGDCIFIYSTAWPPVVYRKSPLQFHLQSLKYECDHHGLNSRKCRERLPEMQANWYTAVACGIVRSSQQWDQLVDGKLQVSHLCHNHSCREPTHLVLESPALNTSRNKYKNARPPACVCPSTRSQCKTHHTKPSDRWMKLLKANTSKAHDKLLRCPFASCMWTVTGETLIPGGVRTRSFLDSNCLPNHKASVRIGEQLMIHINSCQYNNST